MRTCIDFEDRSVFIQVLMHLLVVLSILYLVIGFVCFVVREIDNQKQPELLQLDVRMWPHVFLWPMLVASSAMHYAGKLRRWLHRNF